MEKVLEVQNLKKRFGSVQVLKGIDFDVYENEIVGFVGPNGSGKSTTLKCISNLYKMNEGSVSICTYDLNKYPVKALNMMGVSIESPALYPNLNGHDHFSLVAKWRNVKKSEVQELIAYSGLKDALKKPVHTYSMGMKQRLMLALSMIGSPKLLLLDEPMNGLDPQAVFEFRDKLLLAKSKGTSILLSSHQLNELEIISDRIIFIKKGEIIDTVESDCFHHTHSYAISVDDPQRALKVIIASGIDAFKENEKITIHLQHHVLDDVLRLLIYQNIHIVNITEQMTDLEAYYKKLYVEEEL